MKRSRTLKIYLIDGDPNGLRTVELSNWTGKGIASARTGLSRFAKRSEVEKTGIYVLWGESPDQINKKVVYVGEGDSIIKRVAQHDRDETKDYWTHVVGFVSKDENLTKAHVRYLESKLIADITRSGKAQLKNSTSPDFAKLPESDVSDMDEFYENIRVLLPLVGLNILQQPGASEDIADQVTLEMSPVGTNATAVVSGDEIIVQRGSTARLGGVSSWTSYKGLRDQLVAEGKLVPKNDELYEFTTDVPFASPSAAAAVVFGGNQNGWIAWKVKGTNLTYKDWKEKELAVSNPEALEDAV